MKLNQKLAALFLVSACALSTSVNAQESALQEIVTNYVKSAVKNVSNDIDVQIEKSLVNVTHLISFDSDNTPKGTVKITDLAAETKADLKADKKTKQKNVNNEA